MGPCIVTVDKHKISNAVKLNALVSGLGGIAISDYNKCISHCDPKYMHRLALFTIPSAAVPGLQFWLAKISRGLANNLCIHVCKISYYKKKLRVAEKLYMKTKTPSLEFDITSSKENITKWQLKLKMLVIKTEAKIKFYKEKGEIEKAKTLARILQKTLQVRVYE